MKKLTLLSVLAICTVIILGTCSVFAFETGDTIVSLQIHNPVMEVNGISKEIDAGRGTEPVIIDGRTLVPIRAIIEAFGGAVGWEPETRTAVLSLEENTIRLTIDSTTAYLNNRASELDVAPAVINDRTMLPIRFVAEGFHLGVAWDADSRKVTVVKNTFSADEYERLMAELPTYRGEPFTVINQNKPYFTDYEMINGSFEYYSQLDALGRCNVCIASVAPDLMPTEDRESISSVTPSGWNNVPYDIVDGKYLYNRCHLIGYQLTGENANKKNLITGTRYLNVSGMLPFENAVDDYIDKTGNHVLYRATPVFSGNNLVADGVLLEAYSIEDGGKGVSFCVFCYNTQPGISIDYKTGKSTLQGGDIPSDTPGGIYRTPSGKKYHFDPNCGGKNSFTVTLEEALDDGLTACEKCS